MDTTTDGAVEAAERAILAEAARLRAADPALGTAQAAIAAIKENPALYAALTKAADAAQAKASRAEIVDPEAMGIALALDEWGQAIAEGLAEAYRRADPTLSGEQALVRVYAERPELYDCYARAGGA